MDNELIRQRIEYWQKSADSDLSAAAALFANGNYLQMSFFSHLSVEKYLKSFYWHRRKEDLLILIIY